MENEVRDGFLVSKKRQELWNVQKEILSYFDNFCAKNNIRYFVADGTLLGAVRHKGYIPWDDDIDLYMFREDYNKLLLLEKYFSNNTYFLQSSFNDKLVRSHIQVRKNNTTCLLKGDFKTKHNCGIFIDIFPIDKVPIDKEERRNFYNHIKKYYKKIEMPNKKVGINKKHLACIYNTFIYPFRYFFYKLKILIMGGKKRVLNNFDNLCNKYNDSDSKLIACVSFNSMISNYDMVFNISDYKSTIDLPFEELKVKCPIGYKSILEREYGNYMVFKKGENAHGDMFFDINKDYKYYLKKNRKDFIKLFKPF